MNETGFYQKVRKAIKEENGLVWKIPGGRFNAGVPDFAFILEDGNSGWVELKYCATWPRADSSRLSSQPTALQLHHLQEWIDHGGRGWLLLGVADEWFLLDVPVVKLRHEGLLTRETVLDAVAAHGEISKTGLMKLACWL
jgi:hypothetical protein